MFTALLSTVRNTAQRLSEAQALTAGRHTAVSAGHSTWA